MLDCPRCRQPVDAQAIACPYCKTTLKAHGHPGIPLYRATQGEPLCNTCTYHADDTCNFPKRPDAMDCTLYHDRSQPTSINTHASHSGGFLVSVWIKRHLALLILVGLILVSLILTLIR